jgi:PelA/Pel-15E family pectate lyase
MKRILAAAAIVFVAATPAFPGVLGKIVRYEGLNAAAVTDLAWADYLKRSAAARQFERDTLAAERAGLATIPEPVSDSFHDTSIPLDKMAAWYGSAEARREADIIVSFQTPSGGWGKNQDFTKGPRLKGQMWVPSEGAAKTNPEDFGNPKSVNWHYVGTIDNDATYLQMQFLARVIAAGKDADTSAWRASVLKGIHYLLAAEFPGGGWPQIWPLDGGYHDALTFNDNAFVNTASLLAQVAANVEGRFEFVPMDVRLKAAAAVKRAEAVLLKTQVRIDGKRTIWVQQYEPVTLAPVAARNFEPAALSAAESASLLVFLMSDPAPTADEVAAVHDGVAFLKAVAIKDKAWVKGPSGRALVDQPGALLWARFYDTKTLKPVFGDRDMTIHDDVNDLIPERRDGYSWYNTVPAKALKKYESWSRKYPK